MDWGSSMEWGSEGTCDAIADLTESEAIIIELFPLLNNKVPSFSHQLSKKKKKKKKNQPRTSHKKQQTWIYSFAINPISDQAPTNIHTPKRRVFFSKLNSRFLFLSCQSSKILL